MPPEHPYAASTSQAAMTARAHSSEPSGSFSWNPGTEGASTYRSDMEAAVRRELLGTPLLYAGIGGTR